MKTLKRIISGTIISIITGLIPLPSLAADIDLIKASGELKGNVIIVSGEIVTGDFNKFNDIISKIDNDKQIIVSLDGPGGVLWEAIQIGLLIHKNGYKTIALRTCVSACAYAWLAGESLTVDTGNGAKVGFHAPYIRDKFGNAVNNPTGAAWLGAYLRDIGASYLTITWMTAVGGDSIQWLTPAIAKDLDIAVRFYTKK